MIDFGPITFSLAGAPRGKGRARSRYVKTKSGKAFVMHYTPQETESYEGMIRHAASLAMDGRLPHDGPVRLQLRAIFDIPKSFSIAKRTAAITGALRPAKKPDIDNVIKAWVDAMNGVVFKDDCQIVDGEYSKVYGPAPLVVVTVRAA